MVLNKCLICYRDTTQDVNSASFPSAENFNCQQAEGANNGNTEVLMIFLLRKLLEIPEDTCFLLREHFGSASVWIECCDSCLDLVEKCKVALEQAELFQKQYEELRSNIKTTMLKSPKKPFSAESKCEALVRSHLITQEIDNFIKVIGTETAEEIFPNGNVNFDPNNSPVPAPVASQYSEDSQVLIEFGSTTPVLINGTNTVKSEDEIIISFDNVTENFINITDTVTDAEIFQNSTAFNQNALKAQAIPTETTEVLTGPIIHVMFERINTVKGENEKLNENDLDLSLASSDFGNNIQSGNTLACTQNSSKAIIPLDNLKKPANENLDQLVLPGKSNKSPRGSKSSLNKSEGPKVRMRGVRGVTKRKHKCHKCLKLFKLPRQLRTHLRSHSSTEANKKVFTKRKGNLGNHPNKPAAEVKHKCDICGKSFPYLCRLKIHGRIHSGEKPFGCDICSKSFTMASSLQLHYKGHSGEKPFECDNCGKAFIRKPDLRKHQVKHSQKRSFKCDICDKSFKFKNSMIYHRKKHDDEETS